MLSRSILLVGLLSVAAGCNAVTGVDDLEIARGGQDTGPAKKPACTYPTENFGTQLGQVPPPKLKWEGATGAMDERVTVSIQDYLDCDGSKGINALVVEESAAWCPPCEGMAHYLQDQLQGDWKGLGVQVLILLVEDFEVHKPATVETAEKYKAELDLPDVTTAMDPDFTFYPDDGDSGYPTPLLIDPRTMTIVAVSDALQAIWNVEAFAKKNKPTP